MKTLLQYKKGDRPTNFMLLEKVCAKLTQINGLIETEISYARKILIVLCCVAVICCIALFLAGCGNKVTEGDVYKKEFRPARTETVILPTSIYNGKTTTIINIPYVIDYPDRYVVYIKKYNDEKKEFETENYFVSKEIYDGINIGDYFIFDSSFGTDDEPYTKTKKQDW